MAAASLFWDTNMAAVMSCENTLYSRTPLIRSPMGKKKLAVLTVWPYYRAGSNFMTLGP